MGAHNVLWNRQCIVALQCATMHHNFTRLLVMWEVSQVEFELQYTADVLRDMGVDRVVFMTS